MCVCITFYTLFIQREYYVSQIKNSECEDACIGNSYLESSMQTVLTGHTEIMLFTPVCMHYLIPMFLYLVVFSWEHSVLGNVVCIVPLVEY